MEENRYSKVLTSILIIGIIAIILLLGFFGYDWYKKISGENGAGAFVDTYNQQTQTDVQKPEVEEEADTDVEEGSVQIPDLDEDVSSGSNNGSSSSVPQYMGFDVVGTMEIPATGFKYPILAVVTNKSLEVAVGFLYGAGINEVGNSIISGHNYRNGQFFSDNSKLKIGDKIYVTDNSGTKITYSITQKFETTPEDVSFYVRDTQGKREITLSTCTDDSSARTIIIAVEQ